MHGGRATTLVRMSPGPEGWSASRAPRCIAPGDTWPGPDHAAAYLRACSLLPCGGQL